ncbi:hypothetical protein [Caulobacter sp. FWC2]|uniref:hypothetical protein n=1 Tax=Caulobacter sp. FWC2 TaxID=69664 RepID=UPI000C16255A|nr:hypothetical protein [Caulobacter sp. FWC2]PIB91240.1 hypothetical protein CSW62_06420 [Caulobacter sp. FWC2]
MHAELREKVARQLAVLKGHHNLERIIVMAGGIRVPLWKHYLKDADAIIATLRDALLSDEVVEVGARGLTGARWEVGHRIVKGEKLGAKETARIESHATLSAACAVLLRALQTKESGHGG